MRESTLLITTYDITRLTSHSAKKQCTDQGGKIEHEFKLVKGFTYVFLSYLRIPCATVSIQNND